MKTTHKSRVSLVDSMGHDLRVVDAARVSFQKQSTLDDEGRLRRGDEKLLNYLADHDHWTPFGHVMVTLRISSPVFVIRQWFRHTIGVVRNEVSRRYVDDSPEYYIPTEIRSRPEASIKQGSGAVHPWTGLWIDQIETLYSQVDQLYINMINDGVAPEQARMILPVAHMTEFYETASLAFYGRVAGLRLDGHAQKEIRDLAQLVVDVVAPIAPVAWNALIRNLKSS